MKAYILMLTLIFYSNIFINAVECDTSSVVLGIKNEEMKYLRYFFFHNQFDSASVYNTIGEFRIIDSNGIQRVCIEPRMREYIAVQGVPAQGVDSALMNLAKTEKFTFTQNAKIIFYRHLAANIPCEGSFPSDPTNDGWNGEATKWEDYLWVVGKNKISNLSEFSLELVEKENEKQIAVIDSVGVDRNPTQVLAQRYGTKPDSINHVRILPNDFANKEVFLRVKPKRIGSTQFGMAFRVLPSWISKSNLMEYDSIKAKKDCSEQTFNTLINRYFNDLMTYCDSIKFTTGYLPINLPDTDILSEIQKQAFDDMFFDEVINSNGDTILREKPPYEKGLASVHLRNSQQNRILSIKHLYPNPAKENLNIILQSEISYQNINLNAYNYNGEFIKRLWYGDIIKGESVITVSDINLNKGVYYLHFANGTSPIGVFIVVIK